MKVYAASHSQLCDYTQIWEKGQQDKLPGYVIDY